VPGVEVIIHDVRGSYHYSWPQLLVQRFDDPVHLHSVHNHTGDVETDHLSPRMNARIGSSGGGEIRLAAGESSNRPA